MVVRLYCMVAHQWMLRCVVIKLLTSVLLVFVIKNAKQIFTWLNKMFIFSQIG